LVDVSASFVIVNEGDGGRETDFAPFLNSRQLTDGFGHAALVENAKSFPESKSCVLTFAKLLQN
jgi:hypothetical protein